MGVEGETNSRRIPNRFGLWLRGGRKVQVSVLLVKTPAAAGVQTSSSDLCVLPQTEYHPNRECRHIILRFCEPRNRRRMAVGG